MKKCNIIIVVSVTIFSSVFPILSFCEGKEGSMGGGAAASQPKNFINQMSLVVKERQEKINRIVSDYTLKKNSREEADKKLAPLVGEELKDYLVNLDYQIQVLEKRLKFLKKGKQNPSYLIEERIKEILGEVSPQEFRENSGGENSGDTILNSL